MLKSLDAREREGVTVREELLLLLEYSKVLRGMGLDLYESGSVGRRRGLIGPRTANTQRRLEKLDVRCGELAYRADEMPLPGRTLVW